jgi:hypothetical protein
VGDALWSGLTAGQTLVESVPGQDSNLPSSDTDDFEVLVALRSDYFAEMFSAGWAGGSHAESNEAQGS